MARIFLFDTMFHIFRSFHALPPMNAPDGRPSNAVHGVLSVVARLWRSYPIDGIAFVFESLDGVFREHLDPGYKANRAVAAPELKSQIPLVLEAARCLGIKTISKAGFEADDVIATLARKGSQAGHQVTIVSNDKDMAQMLTWPGVKQLKLSGTGKSAKEEWIEAEEVVKSFGVQPEQVASWLALVGDTVDNIPGLKGVGPKTAAKLLCQWGSLEALIAGAGAEIDSKWGADQPDWRERLRLNLKLSTARDDLDIDSLIEDFHPGLFQNLEGFYQSMGMNRSLAALQQSLFEPTTVAELWRT